MTQHRREATSGLTLNQFALVMAKAPPGAEAVVDGDAGTITIQTPTDGPDSPPIPAFTFERLF